MLTSILITIAVMKVIIAIILTSSCISISIVAAVILSTIANAEASKTGWLYDLSREIWKGYTATRFLYFCAAVWT